MSLYKLSNLKAFLLQYDKKASKRLSQNFLIDQNILDKLIKLAEPATHKVPIFEIGPGPGALTQALLDRGFEVHAVELDQQFAHLLLERLKPNFPKLSVVCHDVLLLDLQTLAQNSLSWSVIANLPYHITTKVLIKLLLEGPLFNSITVMVQYEFFQRVQALSGKDYGIINILIRVCSQMIEGFKVSAHCFYPAPRVDSAVLHLKLNQTHSQAKLLAFYEFLKAGFSSRRKKLISNLKTLFSDQALEKAFNACALDVKVRVEGLSPQKYFELFTALHS